MLKFNQFIAEQEDLVIDVDAKVFVDNLSKLIDDLDSVTEKPFMNSAVFMNAVRGTVERYGIILPPGYEIPMFSLEAETVYALGDTGYYLYMAHNLEDGAVEGYATIATQEELDYLGAAQPEEDDEEEDDMEEKKPWIPPARRDDDSGETSEY